MLKIKRLLLSFVLLIFNIINFSVLLSNIDDDYTNIFITLFYLFLSYHKNFKYLIADLHTTLCQAQSLRACIIRNKLLFKQRRQLEGKALQHINAKALACLRQARAFAAAQSHEHELLQQLCAR